MDLLQPKAMKAQGLAEYALILILVVVIVLVILYFVGPAVSGLYSNVVQSI